MTAAQEKIIPQTQEQQTEFKIRLDSLLSQEVTVENINYIADESLDAVIDIAGDCIDEYRQSLSPAQQEGIKQLQPAEQEEAAFRHYGLGSVPEILDVLQEKVDGIHKIDEFLQSLPEEGFVVLPTDPNETNLSSRSGEYERAEITPRLKTLLFIANQNLGVDLKDITVTRGTNTSEMMRQESYVGVEIPALDRLVLVCDEQGNATYVFDSKALEQQSLATETLLVQTKQELNNLLQQYPELGIRLVYGPQWAGRIANLLTNDLAEGSKNEPAEPVTLLEKFEKAPEDILHTKGLAVKLAVAPQTIGKAIASLQETIPDIFGGLRIYRFHTQYTEGFSPQQQELIEEYLNDEGLLVPPAPEDVLSANSLAKELGVSKKALDRAVTSLQETNPEVLGDITTYRFNNSYTEGFSPQQQELIEEYLNDEALPAAEDVMTANKLAKELGVARSVVGRAVTFLQETTPDTFGNLQVYRFDTRSTEGFTSDQQTQIKTYLEGEGLFAPAPPEGVMSATKLAKEFGAGLKTLRKTIASLKEVKPEEFGVTQNYRFGRTTLAEGFTQVQQKMIEDHLREMGRAALTPRSNQES